MQTVRITAGIYKGRKIATPGGKTHPMGERERLALFNMAVDAVLGARVLDIYAGSGALGIEALSRGAAEVEFVEKNRAAANVIRENLRSIGVEAKVDAVGVAEYAPEREFDLVIADPPYDNFKVEEVQRLGDFVKQGGMLILSHPGEAPVLDGMELAKTRKYAAAHLSVYIKR